MPVLPSERIPIYGLFRFKHPSRKLQHQRSERGCPAFQATALSQGMLACARIPDVPTDLSDFFAVWGCIVKHHATMWEPPSELCARHVQCLSCERWGRVQFYEYTLGRTSVAPGLLCTRCPSAQYMALGRRMQPCESLTTSHIFDDPLCALLLRRRNSDRM